MLGTSSFYQPIGRDAGIDWAAIGTGSRDALVNFLKTLVPVRDTLRRTHLYAESWLRPQLATGMARITATAAESDYFVSNMKMVMRRGDAILPGAAVTYDPPHAVEDLARYGTQAHQGRILDLVAMNRALVDPDGAWGAEYRFTGFWADPAGSDWTPPPGLARFLEDGPPPVVVTMGSMVMFDVERLVDHVRRALRLTGQRGIVVGGWSGIAPGDAPDDGLWRAGDVPYDWLFPRASCVIHHGGCGTVGAVLRAGRPSILLPQIAAQEAFGAMLRREGLATGVFDVQALDPDALAAAIRAAVADERCRKTARRWQEVVAGEGGVARAAELIERHADGLGR